MKLLKTNHIPLAIGVATAWLNANPLVAQTTMVPATYVLPLSVANTNQPGFIWNISEVQLSEPNQLSWAESQMAGLEGPNLADTNAVGIATGPGIAPSNPNLPISFVIPTTINLSKAGGTSKGNFTPDDQMPGLPGTGPNGSDNAAAEALTYLALPAGTNTIGVNSDDGFKLTLGGAAPGDKFAIDVGQFDGGRGAADTIFQVVITQPGLYAARLLWENGGGDANVEFFTVSNSTDILINDLANGGIPAYYGVTTPRAYAQAVDPLPSAIGVSPGEGIHVTIVDGSIPVAPGSVSLSLDSTSVSPTVTRSGTNLTLVDYSPASPWAALSTHTATLVYADGSTKVTNTWSFVVQNYISLDAAWQVTNVDTTKPGFIWNIFANSDSNNKGNSNERAEKDLTLQAVDSSGNPLPNNADPSQVGAAIGAATAPSTPDAPVHFQIATTINLDASTNMPGAPSTDGTTDGQAAEVLTYLTLPAGVINMQIDSDDGWRLYSGPNPADIFGRAVVAEHNDGTGPVKFSFFVPQAGTYPFRLIWENGTGGSHLIWSSVNGTSSVLVNDVAHSGIPAYRALAAGTSVQPFIVGTTPVPAIHQQLVADTNLTVVLADGTHAVDDNSVALTIDGKSITPVKSRQGSFLLVSDNGAGFPGLQLPSDIHTATLTYKDSTGVYSRTQQFSFDNIQILILPTNPVVQETFDSYPEATSSANTVPPGWTAWNYTLENTPGWNLTDKSSDSYKDWIIISTTTMGTIEGGTATYDANQTVNGQPVAAFFSGNVLWATSDGRSGVQAQFCTSKPFDLSSVTNPVMIFSSIIRMSGNANAQADGIEYSIDGGTNWLPGIIYVTIAYSTESYVKLTQDGSIDALATLNAPFSVLDWTDSTGKAGGGTFGSGLAEPVTAALAQYMAPRDQNQGTSARLDGFRLPMASRQKDVRLRFYQLGNCSWWWGVDNLAFYDVAPNTVQPPPGQPHIDSIQASAGNITVKWSNGGTLQSSPSLSSPSWTSTGNSSGTFTEAVGTGSKFYRVSK